MNFKLIKTTRKLSDKNGRSFGPIKLGKNHIYLDHWKERKKKYSQWKMIESNTYKYMGTANVSDEPINVEKPRRNNHLNETITTKFPDISSETLELFFSEIVEAANQLGNSLFPNDTPSKKEKTISEKNGIDDYPEQIREEAESIFSDDPLAYFLETLDLVHYGDEENKEILILAMFTKHVANGKPVHVIIVGTTESGKTSLANKTSKITPGRFSIETTSMSSKAAYYHQDSFREDYNLLIINDFMDSEEAIGTLKALTDTEIDKPKHMTVSDDKKAVILEVKGKNTVIVTAARQLTDRELNRRLLHLNPDESKEHQEKTKEFILGEEAGISRKHHNRFELSQAVYDKIIHRKYEVFVPWILALDTTLLSKTDIKHFTNLVKARTLIYQANRVEIMDNILLSSIEDFQAVAKLWNHIGEIQNTYLPAKAFEMLEILPKWDKAESTQENYGKKISDIAQELGANRSQVKRWLWGHEDQRGLIDLGYIHAEKEGESTTSPWILYRETDKPIDENKKDMEAWGVTQYQMFKGFLSSKDKIKVILSICTLYKQKEYLKKINSEDLTENICQEYNSNIETDQDILKILELIKKKEKNEPTEYTK